jgi:hypothetical protein
MTMPAQTKLNNKIAIILNKLEDRYVRKKYIKKYIIKLASLYLKKRQMKKNKTKRYIIQLLVNCIIIEFLL